MATPFNFDTHLNPGRVAYYAKSWEVQPKFITDKAGNFRLLDIHVLNPDNEARLLLADRGHASHFGGLWVFLKVWNTQDLTTIRDCLAHAQERNHLEEYASNGTLRIHEFGSKFRYRCGQHYFIALIYRMKLPTALETEDDRILDALAARPPATKRNLAESSRIWNRLILTEPKSWEESNLPLSSLESMQGAPALRLRSNSL